VAFKTKLLLKSSGFRIIQTVVGIVIGFIMMPFMISTLGEELYGLWILIASVVGTYYLLDMGFSQAITRYVAKYIHQNETELANRVINTALILYSVLGLVVLLISVCAAKLGVEKLMGSSENITLVQTLLIISGLTLAIEFPSKAFPGIISAYLRYDFIAMVRMIKTIADAVLIYVFLSAGYGLVAIATITLITGTMSSIIYVCFTSSLFKELRFSKTLVDITTLKDVFHFSKWVFLFEMNNMFRNKMDIWFIAFFHSNTLLTVYYVAVRLTGYAIQFLAQATGFTGPVFTEFYAKAEHEKLQQSVVAFMKLNIFLGMVFIVGFYLLGENFIRLWMGESFAYHEAYICLLILGLERFAIYFTAPLQSLLMTVNKHSISAWVSVVETVCAAILMCVLVPRAGITGAALAIAIPALIGRLIVIPFFVAQIYAIGFIKLGARVAIVMSLTALLAVAANEYIQEMTLITLMFAALMITIVQLLIGLLIFNRVELLWVLKKLRRK
jgi:O-antigen/teichoic acid export membrane protein